VPPASAVCQDWHLPSLEQVLIGGYQGQIEHTRSGHQKTVGGVATGELHAGAFLRDLVGI